MASVGKPYRIVNHTKLFPVAALLLLLQCKKTVPSSESLLTCPSLFETIEIPNVGSFQDGGLKRNNPVRLALWESRLIWPLIARPDFVLSLGTGTDICPQPTAPSFRHIWRDGFVPRTYRWLRGIIDGEDEWRNIINDIDKKHRDSFMRLNISLPNGATAMDDLNQVENLSQEVLLQFQTRGDDLKAATNLLLSRLFFELDTLPAFTGHGLYRCQGTIRCRLSGFALVQAAKALGLEYVSFVLNGETLASTDLQGHVCKACHRFSVPLDFYVRHLDQVLTLSIRTNGSERDLSAFPQCIEWFIEQQSLRSQFGSADHGSPYKLKCNACESSSRHSKKRGPALPTNERRIKRLKTMSEA